MIALNSLDTAIQQALEDAALADSFDPLRLAGNNAAAPTILARLADVSDEVAASDTRAWKLRSDMRQTFLTALAESSGLGAALKRQGGNGTAFTRYLATALRGARLKTPPSSVDERETAIVAYEVATASLAAASTREDAFEVAKRELANLRAQTLLDAERLRSRAILAGPLIGRKRERAELMHYIGTGVPAPKVALPPPATRRLALRPFLITGSGGAGKSALLADIVRERRSPEAHGSVVLLDFDRPAICRGGPAEWYSELTRQLGLGHPALSERMKRLRHQAMALPAPAAASGKLISDYQFVEGVRNGLVAALAEEKAAGAPLLVVLDTFEEVLIRSDLSQSDGNLFGDVLRWASELAGIRDFAAPGTPAFSAVRIIVSGRNAPDLGDSLKDWFCGHRVIGALDAASAREFLRRRDKGNILNPAQIRRAVKVVGGQPLSLILFERFACQQPDAVDEVLSQGDLSRIMSGDDAARILYSRFLQRLNVDARDGMAAVDPEKVRRIAHPGLVLRQVTAEHIGAIIAPGCGVSLAPGEAENLFDRLTEQVWLVQEIPGRTPRTVRHRPDVRRLMLPMMSSSAAPGSDLDAQVRAVRRLAVAWFKSRSTQALDENDVEAAYHRAFLGDIDDLFDAELWRRVWTLAPDDVSAMSPSVAALIRYYGLGASSLSREQTEALPEALRSNVAVEQTDESLAAGRVTEAGSAAELIASTPAAGTRPSDARHAVPPAAPQSLYGLARDPVLAAKVNSAFLSGEYHKAAAIGWGAIMKMARTQLDEPLPIEEDLTGHWIWRAALARMISPREVPADKWLVREFHDLLLSIDPMRGGLRSAGFVLAMAIHVASAGRCKVPKNAEKMLAMLASRTRSLSGPGDARLLTLAIAGSGQGTSVNVSLPEGLLPDSVTKAAANGRLTFARLRPDRARPATRSIRRRAHIKYDAYFLLNAKLPELEPLALAVIGPELKEDPNRLINAVRRLHPLIPGGPPPELDAKYLDQRIGDNMIADSLLGSVIAAATAHCLLPELLAELALRWPRSANLTTLHKLANTYAWLLGTEFDGDSKGAAATY